MKKFGKKGETMFLFQEFRKPPQEKSVPKKEEKPYVVFNRDGFQGAMAMMVKVGDETTMKYPQTRIAAFLDELKAKSLAVVENKDGSQSYYLHKQDYSDFVGSLKHWLDDDSLYTKDFKPALMENAQPLSKLPPDISRKIKDPFFEPKKAK
jgi:hypothetical protein